MPRTLEREAMISAEGIFDADRFIPLFYPGAGGIRTEFARFAHAGLVHSDPSQG